MSRIRARIRVAHDPDEDSDRPHAGRPWPDMARDRRSPPAEPAPSPSSSGLERCERQARRRRPSPGSIRPLSRPGPFGAARAGRPASCGPVGLE